MIADLFLCIVLYHKLESWQQPLWDSAKLKLVIFNQTENKTKNISARQQQ